MVFPQNPNAAAMVAGPGSENAQNGFDNNFGLVLDRMVDGPQQPAAPQVPQYQAPQGYPQQAPQGYPPQAPAPVTDGVPIQQMPGSGMQQFPQMPVQQQPVQPQQMYQQQPMNPMYQAQPMNQMYQQPMQQVPQQNMVPWTLDAGGNPIPATPYPIPQQFPGYQPYPVMQPVPMQQPNNENTRYQFHQSRADKMKAALEAQGYKVELDGTVTPLAPGQPGQPGTGTPQEESFPDPPAEPEMPAGFAMDRINEKPEYLQYAMAKDQWRDKMIQYNQYHNQFIEAKNREAIEQMGAKDQQRQEEVQRQQVISQQVQKTYQYVTQQYGFSHEQALDFIQKMSSDEAVTPDNLVQMYFMMKQKEGQPVQPQRMPMQQGFNPQLPQGYGMGQPVPAQQFPQQPPMNPMAQYPVYKGAGTPIQQQQIPGQYPAPLVPVNYNFANPPAMSTYQQQPYMPPTPAGYNPNYPVPVPVYPVPQDLQQRQMVNTQIPPSIFNLPAAYAPPMSFEQGLVQTWGSEFNNIRL
jgi:hypothetical protein